MKTIVLGLDGASYELIDPWIEEGYLQNLKDIKVNGVSGDLESQLPPVTSPNWKCYSTGKNPGKLGIFWWENIDWKRLEVYCPDYRSKENSEIWDYLQREGHSVVIVNIPLSFPPKKVNGYLISGGPDAKNEDYYYPPDLEEKLEKISYRVRPKKTISSERDCQRNFEEIVKLIESRFDLVDDLLKKDDIDFVHLTIFFINVLHHFLWNDDLTKEAWKVIDKRIGRLREKWSEEYNLIIISDHGSNEIRNVFNINTWLEKEGYLKKKKGFLTTSLQKIGLTRSRIVKIAERLGMKSHLRRILPDSILGSVPSKKGGVNREAKGRVLNWEESLAIASGQGPIYLDKKRLGDKYEEFREELIEKLENLESPLTGDKVIRKVYRSEEIYSGKHLDEAPDLIMDQAPNTNIQGEVGREEVFTEPNRWRGENKRTGMFAAVGPDIKKGGKVENVSILDIAPTILHLYGLPVPRDMDGRVLEEILAENSEPAKREVRFVRGEREEIKSKIFSLKKSGKI